MGTDITKISPLGTYGLSAASAYGSYDNYMPSTYAMNGMMNTGMNGIGFGGMDPSMMYGMGMMNPMAGSYGMEIMMQYPKMMHELQNEIEKNQLLHNADMHRGMVTNEAKAYDDSVSALVQKILVNGDVQQGIMSLHEKIKEGDQDGICEEYDKLKTYVYNEYKEEFKNKGDKINAAIAANEVIERMYNEIVSQKFGGTHSLREEIIAHGETAFQNGFYRGLRQDHNQKYVNQTLNHIYGERINNVGENENRQKFGKVLGFGASFAEKGAIGAAAGFGTYIVLGGACSLIKKVTTNKWAKFNPKWAFGRAPLIAAAGFLVWDVISKCSKNSAQPA